MERKSWTFGGAIITVVVAGYGSGQSWHMLEPPLGGGGKYDEGWLWAVSLFLHVNCRPPNSTCINLPKNIVFRSINHIEIDLQYRFLLIACLQSFRKLQFLLIFKLSLHTWTFRPLFRNYPFNYLCNLHRSNANASQSSEPKSHPNFIEKFELQLRACQSHLSKPWPRRQSPSEEEAPFRSRPICVKPTNSQFVQQVRFVFTLDSIRCDFFHAPHPAIEHCFKSIDRSISFFTPHFQVVVAYRLLLLLGTWPADGTWCKISQNYCPVNGR